VSEGFTKKMELHGVGYRAKVEGSDLVLNVGFAHPVRIVPPAGVTFTVVENAITVGGIDKQLIGDVASKIRKVRPPDPYKSKGIRYTGELLKKKAGKSAKAGK
jgi:large subunit ribosomal protein L6